jgi:hypothetical protein
MKLFIDKWKALSIFERVIAVPSLLVIGIIILLISPVLLCIWSIAIACTLLTDDSDTDLFY